MIFGPCFKLYLTSCFFGERTGDKGVYPFGERTGDKGVYLFGERTGRERSSLKKIFLMKEQDRNGIHY